MQMILDGLREALRLLVTLDRRSSGSSSYH
jgi:hypothetical protein